MGKVSHVDKMRMQTMREHGFEAIIRAYTRTNNGNEVLCNKFVAALISLDQRSNARLAQTASDSE